MKVRCVRILDEKTNGELLKSSWITVDRIYHVLELYFESKKCVRFRIVGDDGVTPAYHNADQFELVSSIVPPNWIAHFEKGNFSLSPAQWVANGFWESYFDGNSRAREIFNMEVDKIIQYDP